jgi:hypothetical protein
MECPQGVGNNSIHHLAGYHPHLGPDVSKAPCWSCSWNHHSRPPTVRTYASDSFSGCLNWIGVICVAQPGKCWQLDWVFWKLVKPVESERSRNPARFLLGLSVEGSPPQLDLSLGTRTCMVSDIKLKFRKRLENSANGLMACVNLASRTDTVRESNGNVSATTWNSCGDQPSGPLLINARVYNSGFESNLLIIPPPSCSNDVAMLTFNPISVGKAGDAQVAYNWEEPAFNESPKILEGWLKNSSVVAPPTTPTPRVARQFVRDPCKEWLEAAGQVIMQHTLLSRMGSAAGKTSLSAGSVLDFDNTQVRSGFARFLIASLILKGIVAFLFVLMSAYFEVRTLDDVMEACVMEGRRNDCLRGLFQSHPENYVIGRTELAPAVWATAIRSKHSDGVVVYRVPACHWYTRTRHVGLIRKCAPQDNHPLIEEFLTARQNLPGMEGQEPMISGTYQRGQERRILIYLGPHEMMNQLLEDRPTAIVLYTGSANMRSTTLNIFG